MDLSVVVPTLNGRDRLAACLDALTAHAPNAEVIVANGPSADGTTGMVRDRDDVDVLVEIPDRSVNVARNAGINVASGDAIAFVDFDRRIVDGWTEAVRDGLSNAPVVTGPSRGITDDGPTFDTPERQRIAGREVTYFPGANVAFRHDVLDALDGFDEYLAVGGARDMAHRLGGLKHDVRWHNEMAVTHEPLSVEERGLGWKYRSLSYRMVKNYGIRPTVPRRLMTHAVRDALSAAREVIRGDGTPTTWLGNGWRVLSGSVKGASDGLVARARDRSAARNPRGISIRNDRIVALYDRRSETAES